MISTRHLDQATEVHSSYHIQNYPHHRRNRYGYYNHKQNILHYTQSQGLVVTFDMQGRLRSADLEKLVLQDIGSSNHKCSFKDKNV